MIRTMTVTGAANMSLFKAFQNLNPFASRFQQNHFHRHPGAAASQRLARMGQTLELGMFVDLDFYPPRRAILNPGTAPSLSRKLLGINVQMPG